MKTLIYAWRFLTRAKSYTIINLIGLSFSLACCIVLTRYLHQEQTVDTHCIDREHVYGVKNIVMGNAYQGQVVNKSWMNSSVTCSNVFSFVVFIVYDSFTDIFMIEFLFSFGSYSIILSDIC